MRSESAKSHMYELHPDDQTEQEELGSFGCRHQFGEEENIPKPTAGCGRKEEVYVYLKLLYAEGLESCDCVGSCKDFKC